MSLQVKDEGVFRPVAKPGLDLPDGDPGDVITADNNGKPKWKAPKTKFRGDWESDTLLYAQDFNTGIAAPFSKSPVGPGVVTFDVFNNTVNPPPGPYTKEIQMWMTTDMTNRANLVMDVASLGLSGLTRVKFWLRTINSTWDNGRASVLTDGIETFTRDDSDRTWKQISVPIPASVDQLVFRHLPRKTTGGSNHGSAFAGIELYGSSDPYQLGDFVTHRGKMWKSLINNNATEPGTSAQWEESITLPATGGTTAQRPNAAAAGVRFQYYDEDLDIPVWSNGTVWKNAAGVEV